MDSLSNEYVALGIAILAAVISGFFSGLFGYLFGRKKTRKEYLPRKIEKGTRKNTVLVIGVGQTGKTSLIETLTKREPNVIKHRTLEFDIITDTKSEFGKPPIFFHYTDYRGQNFAQLVANFIREQFKPNTIIRYSDINSLVLVVDLFRHVEEEEVDKTYPELDEDRIKDQLAEWNRTALDAVFGLLTRDELKYVSLFINKIDKWEAGNAPDAEGRIQNQFKTLINDLKERCDDYAEYETIIGSAITGGRVAGPNGLAARLSKYSVPLEKP